MSSANRSKLSSLPKHKTPEAPLTRPTGSPSSPNRPCPPGASLLGRHLLARTVSPPAPSCGCGALPPRPRREQVRNSHGETSAVDRSQVNRCESGRLASSPLCSWSPHVCPLTGCAHHRLLSAFQKVKTYVAGIIPVSTSIISILNLNSLPPKRAGPEVATGSCCSREQPAPGRAEAPSGRAQTGVQVSELPAR